MLDAYDNARFLCEQYYTNAPACNFKVYSRKSALFMSPWSI